MNFAELEALQNGRAIGPVNPPEWIGKLRPHRHSEAQMC